MKALFSLVSVVVLSMSCTPRQFESSVSTNNNASDSVSGRIDPMAFNAYNMWRDGNGSPILDYKEGYNVYTGEIVPDDVFFVSYKRYWKNTSFVGLVTQGAKVENNVLVYPEKDGRTLSLKFFPKAGKARNHDNAVSDCKSRGLRLPTVQELLDFCGVGGVKQQSADRDGYAPHRCGPGSFLWSASVDSGSRYAAWRFVGENGYVSTGSRKTGSDLYGVMCVGAP
jgi:hypothetical protein